MNQFASDKKYLELQGLKALIIKIGAMRAEYMGQNEEVNRILANVIARIDAIVAPDGEDANVLPVTDSYTYTEGTLFECVAKYIQDIRNELGATADANVDMTVYARLDQLENWVSNGFDVEETDAEGNVVTVHYDGLLDRVAALEAGSFAQVECSDAETVKANHKWEASFKNAKGEELAKIALDTKDFVIDGMLGDVKLIAISNEGKSIIDLSTDTEYVAGTDLEEPWRTLVAESATKEYGARYLVFSFKTKDADGHEDPENNYVGDQKLKNIWVSMHDLHDNFDFKAEGAKYIELVAADPVHKVDGSTEITYKVNLTDEVVAVLEKALGEVEGVRSYDEIDADLHTAEENIEQAQADIKELQGWVKDGFTEEAGENGNTATEAEEKKGLLERANNLEDTLRETIGWINEDGIIPVQFVEDYFNFIVFGGGTAAETRTNMYETLKPIIDVEPKGREPQFDDNGKYEGAFNG